MFLLFIIISYGLHSGLPSLKSIGAPDEVLYLVFYELNLLLLRFSTEFSVLFGTGDNGSSIGDTLSISCFLILVLGKSTKASFERCECKDSPF